MLSLTLMSDGCTRRPVTFRFPWIDNASSGRSVLIPTRPWNNKSKTWSGTQWLQQRLQQSLRATPKHQITEKCIGFRTLHMHKKAFFVYCFQRKLQHWALVFMDWGKLKHLQKGREVKIILKCHIFSLSTAVRKMTYFRKPWGALKTIGKYIFIAQKCFLLSYHSVNWVCGLPSWPNNFHVILKLARIWSLAKH